MRRGSVLFNSLEFLILFLPAVYGIARVLRGNPLLFWLSLASFAFYAFAGHAWFLVPMAITTTLDYYIGRRLAVTKHRRAYLAISLVGNLGLLCYFKYSPLIARTIDQLGLSAHVGGALHVVLPAGISFYTFQTLAYVIDIYRGGSQPERNFFKYVAFVAFFPHLVAGPLTRHDQLLPQLGVIARGGITPRLREGVYLFAIGLCKKVLIADRIANVIDPMIALLSKQGAAGAWLALVGYSLQIYFDFSGYSDMAIGLGRLFGIELPRNFNSPYQASSPSDFWRRWHITLSQWLRDYLYISLGGNRISPLRTKINLMATMVLGGLWHGANWTFALWGAYHGLLLVGYHRCQRGWDRLPLRVQQVATYLLVCIGWVFFRASSVHQMHVWFARLVGMRGLFGDHVLGQDVFPLAGLIAIALAVAMSLRNALELDLANLRRPAVAGLAVASVFAVLFMNYSSKFLYFQF